MAVFGLLWGDADFVGPEAAAAQTPSFASGSPGGAGQPTAPATGPSRPSGGNVFRPRASVETATGEGLPLSAPQPRGEPAKPATGISGISFVGKTAVSLGLVLTTFLVFVWVVRKKPVVTARRGAAVEILERISLNARQYLQLVRVGERVLLLGVSPGDCRTLTEIHDPVEVEGLSGRRCDPGSVLPGNRRGVLADDERLDRRGELLRGRAA